jgi:two-component system sensor histidine kinase YesM
MLQWIKKMPITNQLIVLAASIVIILSLVFSHFYSSVTKTMIQENINYTSQILKNLKEEIQVSTSQLEELLKTVGYNKAVTKFVLNEDNSMLFDYMNELDSFYINVNGVQKYIKDIIINGYNGRSYYYTGETKEKTMAIENQPDFPLNHYQMPLLFMTNGWQRPVFLLSTYVADIWNGNPKQPLCMVSFLVDMEFWGINKYNPSFSTGIYMVRTTNNLVLASNQESDAVSEQIISDINGKNEGQVKLDVAGKNYIVNIEQIPKLDAKLVSITPQSEIIKSIAWIRKSTTVFSVLALGVFFILFTILIRNIKKPLTQFKEFIRGMKDPQVKSFKRRIVLEGYQEIEEISEEFNHMLNEIDSLTHRLVKTTSTLYEAELEKKQAELLSLKGQINPHFLYNTLEVIMGVSLEEEAPQTAEMIKCLSRIFKYSIKGKDRVPLKQELSTIESYIHIQQMRFYQMFDVTYDLHDEALERIIPKMILQPLVENAIGHGLEGQEGIGHIYIGAEIVRDKLMLVVQDNGVGMDEKTLEGILQIIRGEDKPDQANQNVGIRNVIHRLRIIYDEDCAVSVTSKLGTGTRFEILIP